MFACDNCIPGNSGHWGTPLAGIFFVALLVLLVLVAWAQRRGWTPANRVISVALLLTVFGAVSAGFPLNGETALVASRFRGGDRAGLDHRRAGEFFVHASQRLFVAAAIAMVIGVALLIRGAIRSHDRVRERGALFSIQQQ
jgi:hypothetical protein